MPAAGGAASSGCYAQTPTAGMICFNDFRVSGGGGGVVGLSFELQEFVCVTEILKYIYIPMFVSGGMIRAGGHPKFPFQIAYLLFPNVLILIPFEVIQRPGLL